MEIGQGELYWVDFGAPVGSKPAYEHPCVVVQRDALNRSALATTIICPLTTNLELHRAPGNVALQAGEGGLPKDCVVNVSQITTVNKGELDRRIGILPLERLLQILNGIKIVLDI